MSLTRQMKKLDKVELVWIMVALLILISAIASVMSVVLNSDSEPKQCLDYTLREYREGDAPAKCQAEVYGDQF